MRKRVNCRLYFIARLFLGLALESSLEWAPGGQNVEVPMSSRSTPTSPLPNATASSNSDLHSIATGSVLTAVGQTATLLPNGSWLLLGGMGQSGPLAAAFIKPADSNQSVRIPSSLNFPRAWHTATLLADGTVLVIGGLDGERKVVEAAELFDPETKTFRVLTESRLPARAFHSATLLTNGTVLVAGGLSSDGLVLGTAEIWNPETKTTIDVRGVLSAQRHKHSATLLPDGTILLWGGTGEGEQSLLYGDLYYPETESFSPVGRSPAESEGGSTGPTLAASIPKDGAQNVAVSTLIALRFSEPLQVRTLNIDTVALQGPEGAVMAKVVPAEGGMLAFVTPLAPLLADANYTLSLDGLTDSKRRVVPPTQIYFTTAGAAPLDDEAWVPNGGSRSGRPESPWQKLAPLSASPGITAVAGQVLKLNGEPLGG